MVALATVVTVSITVIVVVAVAIVVAFVQRFSKRNFLLTYRISSSLSFGLNGKLHNIAYEAMSGTCHFPEHF